MNETIINSIFTLGGLGLFFGLLLSFLSEKFKVKKDERLKKIRDLLPGLDCGNCGYPGCDSFAEAVLDGEDHTKCTPGKSKHAEIAEALGRTANTSPDRDVARIHCHGGLAETTRNFEYHGVKTCNSVIQMSAGPSSCVYGCIGFGDCERVCPVGAIMMNENLIPVVDEDKCIACSKCVKECPKKLYEMIPLKSTVYVKCSSKDPAKDVVKNCKVGCIACKLCEKACKFDAIHITDNLAIIDYKKCTSCGACVNVCPRKIIMRVEKKDCDDKQTKKSNSKPKSKRKISYGEDYDYE